MHISNFQIYYKVRIETTETTLKCSRCLTFEDTVTVSLNKFYSSKTLIERFYFLVTQNMTFFEIKILWLQLPEIRSLGQLSSSVAGVSIIEKN